MSKDIVKGVSDSFGDVVRIIEASREAAFRKVNEELIQMYWRIGEYLSNAMKDSNYGDGYIQSLADYFAENYPELKGFNRRGLYIVSAVDINESLW